jgi:cytidine deaminase
MTAVLRELTSREEDLVEAARAVVDNHGDGDIHTMGAAVLDSNGGIHTGINVYHFNGGPCAELVALGAARAAGARALKTIVAVGDNGRGVRAPCGRDRQILIDNHPDIEVIVPTDDGPRAMSIVDLLPYAYDWEAESQP